MVFSLIFLFFISRQLLPMVLSSFFAHSQGRGIRDQVEMSLICQFMILSLYPWFSSRTLQKFTIQPIATRLPPLPVALPAWRKEAEGIPGSWGMTEAAPQQPRRTWDVRISH